MSKKLILFLSLLLIAAMVLVACGGGEETTEEPTAAPAVEQPTEAPTEVPTEAPMEEPTEVPTEEPMEEPTEEPAAEAAVQLVVWGDEVVAPAVEALAPQFLTDYGIELIVQQVAFDDQREQIRIAAPAGEGPDIFVTAHDRLGEFVGSGLISPISLGDKADSFVPSSLTAFTYDGELYGLPYATENVGFFRNVDLVPDPVETWDDVQTIGAALKDEGTVTAATALSSSNFHAYGINTAFGGYIFGVDENGSYDPTDVGLDSDGFIASGEYLQGLVDAGLLPSTVDGETAASLFETGQIPFVIEGPWQLNRFRESGVNYTIDPLPAGPAGPGAPFLGVRGFVVNAFSENKLLAETFLTELVASDDVMMQLFENDPRPPAWIPTAEAIDDVDIANFGAIAPVAQPMPAIPEMGSVWGSWGDAIQLILNGEEAPAAALQNAAQQVRDTISQ